MKIAHCADSHLGFTAYQRSVGGVNLREQDVETAFQATIDQVITCQPDVVLHAGDLFHRSRPGPRAILAAFQGFARLRAALPDVPIVLIEGNHDHPRATESGHILDLFRSIPKMYVATTDPMWVELRGGCVVAVPHAVTLPHPLVQPDRRAPLNVLMMHGDVPAIAHVGDREDGGHLLPTDETGWDHIALGHYHVPCQVGPRTWYAGSPEYVSSNPWRESQEPAPNGARGAKGWLEVELTPETLPVVTFHMVPVRRVADLDPIDAEGLTASALDVLIADQATRALQDGASVVRQVVLNVDPLVGRALDQSRIREHKAAAAHYQLVLRRPETVVSAAMMFAGRSRPLVDVVRDYLRDRAIPADLARADLLALFESLVVEADADVQVEAHT